MKIITKSTNINITEAVRDHLYSKMSTIERFIDGNTKVEVELEKTTNHHKSGDIYRVGVNIWNKGKLNRVEKTSADIYSSIDLAQADLFNVLSSKKDKSMTLFKRGAQKIKNVFKRGWFGGKY